MEVPVPSLDNVKTVWDWALGQLGSWFKVLSNPVAVLSAIDLDSSDATIKAIQFAAFPLTLGPALMTPISLLNEGIRTSVGIFGYFVANVILNVFTLGIAVVGQRLGAKLVRGKGSWNACAISSLYGTAFWPIFVLTAYVGANYPESTKGAEAPPGPMLIVSITALVSGLYVLLKFIPMTMFVHRVGRFRAWVICSITVIVTGILVSIASSSFLKPMGM
jgi:hypothetical protein